MDYNFEFCILTFELFIMYYYIFDQPKGSASTQTYNKIKDIVTNLGITGENVMLSPARTIEEAVQIGFIKGYSTFVAIGSDFMINKVASLLALNNVKDKALGIIPLKENSALKAKLGIKDIQSAVENLKYRKLEIFDLAFIEPNKFFLTRAYLNSNRPIPVKIKIDDFVIETKISSLELEIAASGSGLMIKFKNDFLDKNIVSSFASWLLGKEANDKSISILHGKNVKIETEEPYPIYIDNEIVTKSPFAATVKPNVLKLITARDRIK